MVHQHACILLLLVFLAFILHTATVATCLKCGELFNKYFIPICPQKVAEKFFLHRLTFSKGIDKKKVGRFLRGHSVY